MVQHDARRMEGTDCTSYILGSRSRFQGISGLEISHQHGCEASYETSFDSRNMKIPHLLITSIVGLLFASIATTKGTTVQLSVNGAGLKMPLNKVDRIVSSVSGWAGSFARLEESSIPGIRV